jgi:uncharacterized protein
MAYLIRMYDKPDSAELRAAMRADHLAYMQRHTAHVLAAGGFLDETDNACGGGIIIVDFDRREAAERFAANDPYKLAGLFERVEIIRWRKVIFDGEFVV